MKILLVNPPVVHAAVTTLDWMPTSEDIGAFPPIGLMYLAAILRKHTDYEIKIIDMDLEKMSVQELGEWVARFSPDIAGITTFTPIFYDVMQVTKEIKRVKKDCYVCLGGAHTSTYPMETMEKSEVDFLMLGESEFNFLSLVQTIDCGKDLRKVPGLVMRDQDGKILQTSESGYIEDINALPFPAFDLLPFQRYHSAIGTGDVVGTICSSRGCPYECTFCCKPYRTYRMRTPDNIIAEMKQYYDRGVREFFFFDDMFNITPKRVIDVSWAIMTAELKITWSFRGRVDQVTEDMLKVAKKSGCRQILFGVETATDEGLRLIKKKISTQQILRTVKLCKKVGMETNTNWIIGFPHDKTVADIENLIRFAIKVNSDYAQFNILIPYAGTEIFREGVAKGILPEHFWRDYTINPVPRALVPIWEEHLSRQELSQLLRRCYQRFYFRWGQIVKHFIKIKNLHHLQRKIKGVFILLGQGGYKKRGRKHVHNGHHLLRSRFFGCHH